MSRRAPNNKVDVVLGAQWGDEGKGKKNYDYGGSKNMASRKKFKIIFPH